MPRINRDAIVCEITNHRTLDLLESAVFNNHISKVFFADPESCVLKPSESSLTPLPDGNICLNFDSTKIEINKSDFRKIVMAPDHSQITFRLLTEPLNLQKEIPPPGLYFDIANHLHIQPKPSQAPQGRPPLVRGPNKIGFYLDQDGTPSIWIDRVHFARAQVKVAGFGITSFALLALTARHYGFRKITLLAAGGSVTHQQDWGQDASIWSGYRFWPSVGFDGPIDPSVWDRMDNGCGGKGIPPRYGSVMEAFFQDKEWWQMHGNGGFLSFDLCHDSPSWSALATTLETKNLLNPTERGDPHEFPRISRFNPY